MEHLTEFYPAFKQVGVKKTGGKGCAIICKDNDYECKRCPLQEVLDKLYRLEREKEWNVLVVIITGAYRKETQEMITAVTIW